jgi:hypothetical protein
MLTFDEEAHIYYWNEEPVVNVTTILESTGLSNFSFIPNEDLKMACDYGHQTHKVTIYEDLNIANIEDITALSDAIDEKYKNFNPKKNILRNFETYRQFKADHEYKPIFIEEKFYSKKYRFAGTLDRVCEINGKKYLLDYKTGVLSWTAGVQTAGYDILLEENCPKFAKLPRAILHFKNEGGYELVTEKTKGQAVFNQKIFSDRQIFLSALTMYHAGLHEAFKKKLSYHYMESLNVQM